MPINYHPTKYKTATIVGESKLHKEQLYDKIISELKKSGNRMPLPSSMPNTDDTLQGEVYAGENWIGCIDVSERSFGSKLPSHYTFKIWTRKDEIANYLISKLENIEDLIVYHPETTTQQGTDLQSQSRSKK